MHYNREGMVYILSMAMHIHSVHNKINNSRIDNRTARIRVAPTSDIFLSIWGWIVAGALSPSSQVLTLMLLGGLTIARYHGIMALDGG